MNLICIGCPPLAVAARRGISVRLDHHAPASPRKWKCDEANQWGDMKMCLRRVSATGGAVYKC